MNTIIFTNVLTEEGVLEQPLPASRYLPDWYKDAKSYLSGKKEPSNQHNPNATIKRCMPLFDMMTAGYVITTPCDIYVQQNEQGTIFTWSDAKTGVAFQPIEQVQNHPFYSGVQNITRMVLPWSIKTPKGWSILLMGLSHRESVFEVLPGIVDTDKYASPTNTFFKLTDPLFEGLIPMGTPYAQIIPFKRENWKSKLGSDKEIKEHKITEAKLSLTLFDRYKNLWWQKKEYN
jgi:hypothetical protein